MRIKEKTGLFLAESGGSFFLKALGLTLRIKIFGKKYHIDRRMGKSRKVVYAFWHCHIIPLAVAYRNSGIRVMVSEHRDGEIIARIAKRLGFKTQRGSTTRGGIKALKGMMRIWSNPESGDVAITPDGPRGPARKAQKGAIFIAAKTGSPLVPVGVACERTWICKSWDLFQIPKPFSRIAIVVGNEIRVGRELDRQKVEEMALVLQLRLQEAEENAFERLEKWNE